MQIAAPTLPSLREELALLPGPVLPDGQPSWTLHDPVRNLFFRIDWPTFEVLQRWGQGSPAQMAQDVCECTTLAPAASIEVSLCTRLPTASARWARSCRTRPTERLASAAP